MRPDIEAVRGNIYALALGPAEKYPEFEPLRPLCEITRVVIVVAHSKQDKDGSYEVIDGAHRLVAFCRAGIDEVDAYVANFEAAESGMTRGDRIELAIYRLIDLGGDTDRVFTLPLLQSLIPDSGPADISDALLRLEGRGFIRLDKWINTEGRFVPFKNFAEKGNFFYVGEFRVKILPEGRQHFERRTRESLKQRPSVPPDLSLDSAAPNAAPESATEPVGLSREAKAARGDAGADVSLQGFYFSSTVERILDEACRWIDNANVLLVRISSSRLLFAIADLG